jgi:hypothetical protein
MEGKGRCFTGRERNRGLQKRPNAKKRWRYALAALCPGDGSTAGGSGGNGVEVTVGLGVRQWGRGTLLGRPPHHHACRKAPASRKAQEDETRSALSPGDGSTAGGSGGDGVEVTVGLGVRQWGQQGLNATIREAQLRHALWW